MVGSVGNGLVDLGGAAVAVNGVGKGMRPEAVAAAVAMEVESPPRPAEEEGEGSPTRREIVLGRNVHTASFAVKEPDADDEETGEREAAMASVLALYRRNLVERTKHHLGMYAPPPPLPCYYPTSFSLPPDLVRGGPDLGDVCVWARRFGGGLALPFAVAVQIVTFRLSSCDVTFFFLKEIMK